MNMIGRPPESPSRVVLAARNLVKRYGGVTALADGHLRVAAGDVLALMGANGSGKSTLTKIVTGVVAPDSGQIELDGQPVRFSSPLAARRSSIAAVYQELSLIPDLTVAENVWLAHEPLGRAGFIRKREVQSRTAALLDLFSGTVSAQLQPDALVASLPPDEKQIVEILKAISLDPRVLILDEATASLDMQQVRRLFELIGQWRTQGKAIVFVSHRMEEIFRIATRATVLRSGQAVADVLISETSAGELVRLMIEGAAPHAHHAQQADGTAAPIRVAATELQTSNVRGVSLSIRAGELVGLGGLQGQGQTDVLLALFGAIRFSGSVTFNGQPTRFTNPRQAIRSGFAFVPGDRGAEGLLSVRSILENVQLPSWRRYGAILNLDQARSDALEIARSLKLIMASLDAPVSSLSGGNAQKVVLGKWLLRQPSVLLLNDPTKGVDVGAKGDFYTILDDLRAVGMAILLYSSDDDELLGLCDRVLVMHDGTISAELAGPTLTRDHLVAASMGPEHRRTHDRTAA